VDKRRDKRGAGPIVLHQTLLSNTRKTGRVRATLGYSSSTYGRRGTAPFAPLYLPDNPERSIQRVRARVALGGHDVADSDVRRRYARSLSNAGRVLRIVHQGLVVDNSGAEPGSVFEIRQGRLFNMADEIPSWASALLPGIGVARRERRKARLYGE
jgi:hypothetical protein